MSSLIETAQDVNPEEALLTQELQQIIQLGLEKLPLDQRVAVVLCDIQGLSYEEAATVTGANLGTVKSRVNRARSRMRDFLRERGVVPSAGELSSRAQRSISVSDETKT